MAYNNISECIRNPCICFFPPILLNIYKYIILYFLAHNFEINMLHMFKHCIKFNFCLFAKLRLYTSTMHCRKLQYPAKLFARNINNWHHFSLKRNNAQFIFYFGKHKHVQIFIFCRFCLKCEKTRGFLRMGKLYKK
jgi:hypothetical protein